MVTKNYYKKYQICQLEGCGLPLEGQQKRYCSHLHYTEANRTRARKSDQGRRNRAVSSGAPTFLIPCIGHQCRGEKLFESLDKVYNRVCNKCKNVYEYAVEINGYTP
jgi:hypothetical protein